MRPAYDDQMTRGSGDLCCLEHAALEALPAPVLVHDAECFVYVNALARELLGIENVEGLPVEDFICRESVDASSSRRSLMLESNTQLGDVPIKVRLADGSTPSITARAARACFGAERQRVLVQVVRSISGRIIVPYAPDASFGSVCDDSIVYECVHQAAFDVLPAPAAIVDLDTLWRMNRVYASALGADGPLRDMPLAELVHPDFASAGRDRRHLVIELGAAVSGASVKFLGADSKPVYAVIDAERVEFAGAPYMAVLAQQVTAV